MRDIGKNIRQLRTAKNMTQDELAEKLFVTRQTVSNYETGKSRPDVEMLVKISDILETDIHQVIYGPEPVKLTKEKKRLLVGGILTLVLLVVNFLSVMGSPWLGTVLDALLTILSVPMKCGPSWALSIFLWAFLFLSAAKRKK